MKKYSEIPKSQEVEPHHQMQFSVIHLKCYLTSLEWEKYSSMQEIESTYSKLRRHSGRNFQNTHTHTHTQIYVGWLVGWLVG